MKHLLHLAGGRQVVHLLDDHHWTLDDSGLVRVWDGPFEGELIAAYSPSAWTAIEEVAE